ncbi:MAG: nucleotidyltransferase family protein [Pseudomonadota bacterium]
MDYKTQTDKLLKYITGVDTGDQLSTQEWEEIVQQAAKHLVTPLLYQALKNAGSRVNVPASIMERLQGVYYGNALSNKRLYIELSQVLKNLHNQGIDVILLKGAYLAKFVYKDIALRPRGDIDLLVRKTELAKAEKILLEMGYGPTDRPSIEAQCARVHHLIPFKKRNAMPIEIHWTIDKLSSPFKLEADELWRRAQPINGINAFALAPEDLLLHLCLHTTYFHSFNPLKFLCDFPKTLQYYQDEIDWELLFHRAHQWGANKTVFLTLYLVRELLNVPLEQLERFKPDDFNPQVVTLAKTLIFNGSTFTTQSFAKFWEAKPFKDKVIILMKRVFPPPEFMALTYPVPSRSIQMYLFYLIRLKYLLVRYGTTTWRLLRGNKRELQTMENMNNVYALQDWMKSSHH